MNTALLRRAARARIAVRHPLVAVPTVARTYATPSHEEPDPQLNGYPQLPFVPRANLPPLGWTDNLTRRNFGDTLHEQEEVLSMWGPDAPPLDPNSAMRQFLVAVAGFVTVGFIINAITPDPPAIRREYPFDGLVKELGGLEENKARPETDDLEH
ncbi:hypothetical protein BDN70DRAFT_871557 [Pholiota conissans]|uniref:Uncharacterized protein n=1 Tax=Pholiota conissans TaxID=109636 RepID=A0A9P5ZCZ5_9AGAR|nr:hypothetical protein BDN70DRAFT_871557 [Pholiota conissans]